MQSSHRSFFFLFTVYILHTSLRTNWSFGCEGVGSNMLTKTKKKKKKKIQNKTYQKYWQQPKRKKESKQEDNTRVKNDCQKRVIAFTEQL